MKFNFEQILTVWPIMNQVLIFPHNEQEYNVLVHHLDQLIDIVGEDESHPLASLMEPIGILIEYYENENISEIKGDGISVLSTLMEEHGLEEKDLPEIGNFEEVSNILSGKAFLNINQIKGLSKRFNLPEAVFI